MLTIIYVHGTYSSKEIKLFGLKHRGLGDFLNAAKKGNPKSEAEQRALINLGHMFRSKGNCVLRSFYWSGGDTRADRQQAGTELYACLQLIRTPVLLVTHSHGGNVAGHALSISDAFHVDATCLFACPVIGGADNAWHPVSVRAAGEFFTFSHPRDGIQVTGAAARNSIDMGASWGSSFVGDKVAGAKNIVISPGGFFTGPIEAHSLMHSEEAFKMACGGVFASRSTGR